MPNIAKMFIKKNIGESIESVVEDETLFIGI